MRLIVKLYSVVARKYILKEVKCLHESGASINGDVLVVDAQGKVVDVVQTAAGNFTIINLKTGSYTVKALVDGYEIIAQTVTITAEDTVKDNVNFVLNPR